MEDRLKRLIEGNSELNRIKLANEWKAQGKKIIGILSTYVPEEVIYAAGMLPWRITGSWKENISRARLYRTEGACSYCNHVLESFLNGELDFLDGVVVADIDQDLVRLWDVLVYLNKPQYCHLIHMPFTDISQLNYNFLRDEIRKLIQSVEKSFGVKISNEELKSSIGIYNKTRDLLTKLNKLRKRELPPLSGAEMLGITTTAMIMPKDQFNKEIEALMPYIEKRKVNIKTVHPRIMVMSDMLDNPAYLNLVEENCLVAMDDMDTGIRYFTENVDNSIKDPAAALAKRYLGRHASPRLSSWDRQIEQVIKWAKEYNIDGVLSLPHAWCYPQRYRMPFMIKKLSEAGIFSISLEREYHFANAGQLRTRIGAFLEMLGTKSGSRA